MDSKSIGLIRQYSSWYRSRFKNLQASERRIQNQPGSTDWKLDPTDWKSQKIRFCLILFHVVFKGNPKACFVVTLEVLLWDPTGSVLSLFKVTTGNHSYTIRTGRSENAATRSTTTDDLKLQGCSWSHKNWRFCVAKSLSGISKSQAWEFVLQQIQKEKESVDSKFAHGCVSKLLLEVAIDLGLNLIVKTLILY